MLAYVISLQVVGRATEITWHNAKFGDPTLSLGVAAAQFYVLLALAIGITAYMLYKRAPAGGIASKAGAGALGMLIGASLLYLAIGTSPFASWRS